MKTETELEIEASRKMVFFTLLWILGVKDLLKKFEERDCRGFAYVDDVVLLIEAKFLDI